MFARICNSHKAVQEDAGWSGEYAGPATAVNRIPVRGGGEASAKRTITARNPAFGRVRRAFSSAAIFSAQNSAAAAPPARKAPQKFSKLILTYCYLSKFKTIAQLAR
ncbi:hypothetical protein PCLA_01r0359 [Pseudomonas citronellolis]|nr:hypothetical protein PCLA_01r0359 [Pseudomonas citronellolis]